MKKNVSKLYTKSAGEGPNLVLLHGWGMHSAVWGPIWDNLCQHFRVTCIDLPGFGQSPLGDCNYTMTEVISLILPQLPEQSIILGWSLGGLIAHHIAEYYPDYCQKFIGVGTSPHFMALGDWPGMQLSVMETFSQALIQNYGATLNRFLGLQLLGSPSHKQLQRELLPNILATGHPHPKALEGGLQLLKNQDYRQSLEKTEIASLYIFGRLDTLVPAAVGPIIHASHRQCEIAIFQQSAHMPFLSEPMHFINTIRDFIQHG